MVWIMLAFPFTPILLNIGPLDAEPYFVSRTHLIALDSPDRLSWPIFHVPFCSILLPLHLFLFAFRWFRFYTDTYHQGSLKYGGSNLLNFSGLSVFSLICWWIANNWCKIQSNWFLKINPIYYEKSWKIVGLTTHLVGNEINKLVNGLHYIWHFNLRYLNIFFSRHYLCRR